jgi:hypothetical protein
MTDIFVDKKSVHFKLDRDVHLALRAKLFKHNITMQELFDEFAQLVATDTAKGQSIIESIVNKKIKKVLSTSSRVVKRRKKESFKDLDSDALYNMINNSDEP